MKEDKVREATEKLRLQLTAKSYEIGEVYNLLEEALAPEPRFYKNQPVLVRDDPDLPWAKDCLKSINSYLGFSYRCSKTGYRYCKPDPEAVSLPNWIEHNTGVRDAITVKTNQILLMDLSDGDSIALDGRVQRLHALHKLTVRYCIIPLPEFIED